MNQAARLQGESGAGEVVVPADWRGDPAAAKALAAPDVEAASFRAVLKGVAGEKALLRLKIKP